MRGLTLYEGLGDRAWRGLGLALIAVIFVSLGAAKMATAQSELSSENQLTSPAASKNGKDPNKAPEPKKGGEDKLRKIEAQIQAIKEAADASMDTSKITVAEELDMPTQTEFESAAFSLREHLKQMRVMAIKYHLTDSPLEARTMRRDWVKMLNLGRTAHQRMVDMAIAEFRGKPDPTSDMATFLFNVAARNADADRFDGMLELVKLLHSSGFAAPQFELCVGLTAAAQADFEFAKPFLEAARDNLEKAGKELAKAEKMGDEERQKIADKMIEMHVLLSDLAKVDLYRPLWEEELKSREADEAGEPLPRVLIQTTKGDIEVELFENEAPNTVANFIELCEKNFYDGLPFHRVLEHFMAQGGCPNRDGSGGPGYTIHTELDVPKPRNFFRGTLGMALAGTPDSGGSQFFICYVPRAHLNGNYVAFGRVVSGMNVVSDFTRVDPDEKDKQSASADSPDEIVATQVLRKRAHPYKPKILRHGHVHP